MPDEPKPNEEVRPQGATVRPEPVRAKVTIPTPTILVTDTQVMDETGLEVPLQRVRHLDRWATLELDEYLS